MTRPAVVIVALTAVLSPAAAVAQPQGVRLFVLMRVNGGPKPKGVPRASEAQLQAGNAGDLYGFWGMPLEGDAGRQREAKGATVMPGRIALQSEGGEVRYRRVESWPIGSRWHVSI